MEKWQQKFNKLVNDPPVAEDATYAVVIDDPFDVQLDTRYGMEEEAVCTVTSVKELPKNSLRLNVIFGGKEGWIAVPGYRLANGLIQSPMQLVKGRWYATTFLSQERAEGLYWAVRHMLEVKGLGEQYTLLDKSTVIWNLVNHTNFYKCYPEMLGNL